jgi:hypothetical protein
MIKFSPLVLALFCANVSAQVDVEVLCYTSGGNKPIRLEMRTYYDPAAKWNGGFVKYEKSKTPISISQVEFQSKVIDKNRPSEATMSWVEITMGHVSGAYERVSQGASVSALNYAKVGNGKQYSFLLDANTSRSFDNGCDWKPIQ